MSEPEFDVFLSHVSKDKAAVEVIAHRLADEAGVRPFLDKWHLTPGELWQDELMDALDASSSIAVFVGPHGEGAWRLEEMRVGLDRAATTNDEFRVIPVLLPGADPSSVDGFLAQRTWVDFRSGLDDELALTRLAAAIRGEAVSGDEHASFELPDEPAPYRGLWRFEPGDEAFFFGRQRDVDAVVGKLNADRFVAVIGASGSGKSSLIRAGVLGNIDRLDKAGANEWRTVVCIPGNNVFRHLAQAVVDVLDPSDSIVSVMEAVDGLTRTFAERDDGLVSAIRAYGAGTNDPVLVFVDQFEELFTLAESAPNEWRAIAERFVANLVTAVNDPESRVRVVITMRADFMATALSVPGLRELFHDRQVMLGALSREQLTDIIVLPARSVGAFFEKGLVATIIDDVDSEPGALPLLQHALLELWNARRGPWLTIDAYQQSGGVVGALAHRAQETLDRLPAPQQAAARGIFIRLTTLGEGVPDTRRRAKRQELYPAGANKDDVDAVIHALGNRDARLIVLDGDTVEVAHEALLRQWPTVRGWLEEDRRSLLLHRHLGQSAADWAGELDEDPSGLYRGTRLVDAVEFDGAHPGELNELEQRYLQASAAAARHEEEQVQARLKTDKERIAKLRRRLIASTVAFSLAVVGVVGAVVALRQANAERDRSERLVIESKSRELAIAADRALETNPDLAALLAIESERLNATASIPPSSATSNATYAIVTSVWSASLPHEDFVRAAVFSPDGKQILTAGDDNAAMLWDLDGNKLATLDHSGAVVSAAFSTDGTHIVTAGSDGTAKVWDTDGTATAELVHQQPLLSAAFSHDGTRIVTASEDATAQVWDIDGTHRLTLAHGAFVRSAVFGPDDARIVTASEDSTAKVWDIDGTNTSTLTHDGAVLDARFSSDGTRIVTASSDGTAKVWGIDGTNTATLTHSSGVRTAEFNPDGDLIVTASDDGTARVWDPDGTQLSILGHGQVVQSARFSPDGSRVVTASNDRTATVWELDGTNPIVLAHQDNVVSAVFSADGKRVVSASRDNTAKVWDLDGTNAATLRHGGTVWWATFDPASSRVVTASEDSTARIWDLGGNEVAPALVHDDRVWWAIFSPDREHIATGSEAGAAQLWDLDGSNTSSLEHDGGVLSANFSADGTRIVTASRDRTAKLWDLDGTNTATLQHDGVVRIASFAPDDTRVLTASEDGTARLWDLDGTSVATFDHDGPVVSAVFSPDGELVATGSEDGTAKIWNLDGTSVATLDNQAEVYSVMFSPDGASVTTSGSDGTAKIWTVDGTKTATLTHQGFVRSAVFSPDGKLVVTASEDQTAKVWGLDGTNIATLPHERRVWRAEFSPDGRWIVTGSDDGTAIIWPTPNLGDELEQLQSRLGSRPLTIEECRQHEIEPCPSR